MGKVIITKLERGMDISEYIDQYQNTSLWFTASWCRFCPAFKEELMEQVSVLEKESDETFQLIKIDPREFPEIKRLYAVETIPAIIHLGKWSVGGDEDETR